MNLTITTTSVSESEDEQGFRMYPNPSNGKFIIEHTPGQGNFRPEEIEIFSVIGTKIFSSELIDSKTEITSNLPAGLYMYRLKYSNSLVFTGKLVIQE